MVARTSVLAIVFLCVGSIACETTSENTESSPTNHAQLQTPSKNSIPTSIVNFGSARDNDPCSAATVEEVENLFQMHNVRTIPLGRSAYDGQQCKYVADNGKSITKTIDVTITYPCLPDACAENALFNDSHPSPLRGVAWLSGLGVAAIRIIRDDYIAVWVQLDRQRLLYITASRSLLSDDTATLEALISLARLAIPRMPAA
jgi:hypothetical protein